MNETCVNLFSWTKRAPVASFLFARSLIRPTTPGPANRISPEVTMDVLNPQEHTIVIKTDPGITPLTSDIQVGVVRLLRQTERIHRPRRFSSHLFRSTRKTSKNSSLLHGLYVPFNHLIVSDKLKPAKRHCLSRRIKQADSKRNGLRSMFVQLLSPTPHLTFGAGTVSPRLKPSSIAPPPYHPLPYESRFEISTCSPTQLSLTSGM